MLQNTTKKNQNQNPAHHQNNNPICAANPFYCMNPIQYYKQILWGFEWRISKKKWCNLLNSVFQNWSHDSTSLLNWYKIPFDEMNFDFEFSANANDKN